MAEPERCGQMYEPRPGALYRRCKRPAGHNGEHGPENAGPSAPERRVDSFVVLDGERLPLQEGLVEVWRRTAPERPPADDETWRPHQSESYAVLRGVRERWASPQTVTVTSVADVLQVAVEQGLVQRPPGATVDRDALALVIFDAQLAVENDPDQDDSFAAADAVLALLAGEETTDEPEQCGQPYWRYFGHGLCSRPIGHDGWCGPQPSDVDVPRRKETTDGTT